jgi:hypothetical protein
VVNGKPALEWVMERQCVKADKRSGILNDANHYAIDTVGDPAYPLLLFQRVITVSLKTIKIVRGLSKLGDRLMAENESLVSRAAKLISQQEQAKNPRPLLTDIRVSEDNQKFERLNEGKWISGRFDNNIRIDQATYGAGQQHAHIYGRKGNEIGVINIDGSASHGSKCRLHDDDANALRTKGYPVKPSNIVEWVELNEQLQMLFG